MSECVNPLVFFNTAALKAREGDPIQVVYADSPREFSYYKRVVARMETPISLQVRRPAITLAPRGSHSC